MTTHVLERSPQLAVLHLEGSLRAPVHGDLRRKVRSLLASGERRIQLDLTRLSDLDAAGIGELIAVYNSATAASGTLQVTKAGRRVRTLLEAAGVHRLLTVGTPAHVTVDDRRCQLHC